MGRRVDAEVARGASGAGSRGARGSGAGSRGASGAGCGGGCGAEAREAQGAGASVARGSGLGCRAEARGSGAGRRRVAILFAVGAAAVVVLFALDLWTGSVGLSFAQVWDALFGVGGAGDAVGAAVGGAGDAVGAVSDSAGIGDAASRVSGAVSGVADETAAYIVRGFRLPKAVVALLAGAALGASGLQMQTLFRNPLAGPYVLGISSGASLGVALFLLGAPLFALAGTGLGEAVRSVGVVGAAWIGAGLIFLLVAAASRRIKDIMAILIIGMMLGSAAGAVVEVLQYFSDQGAVKSFVVWTMGSLGGVTAGPLRVMAPVVV
ncbi:MAG: iron chelate uptake ABC transporter family permease subunit, partial [Alistipes sp.]|nr:iron chelate uptake ABC transporter family permease subunit [Alistipes sp.]